MASAAKLPPVKLLRRLAWEELTYRERQKMRMWMRQYYLRSKSWRERRAALILAAGKKCERCGVVGGSRATPDRVLHVHHLTYDTLGYESQDDVEVVCAVCHREEHHGA